MRFNRHRVWKFAIILVMLSSVFLWGCGEDSENEKTANQKFPKTLEQTSSETVASNNTFSLEWDSNKTCVLLRQHDSGKVWSTIPYDFYQTEEVSGDLNSPIYIEYIDKSTHIKEKLQGYGSSVETGRVASKKIADGIEVTYYFDNVGISVPVQYFLREDSLAIAVDFEHAQEGENQLLSVSVAPFLCSVANNSEDSYLVIPSGSGALMYVDERLEGKRTYSGEIYGDDPAGLRTERLVDHEAIRLPIFGVKRGEDALLAIVEDGQEAAYITAYAGNSGTGYSNAYVSFYARGFDIAEWADREIYQTSRSIDVRKSTVVFYPITGENANYIGMAKRYQTYLKDTGEFNKQTSEQAYALYVTGGAQIEELFWGMPIKKTRALTTFQQVQTMLEELTKETALTPAVQLRGFGESGLDPGKVAGGFNFSSAFGSNDQRLLLEEFCENEGIGLFTDFDLIYFRSSGSGFHSLNDSGKSAIMRKVKLYEKDKALWDYDKGTEAYFLLSRTSMQSAIDKLEKTIHKKQISGVSLSTLGQTAYSDYSADEYKARGNSVIDTQTYIEQLSMSGVKVATQSANAYAAVVSDCVLGVPIGNGDYNSLDACIPLYQMVFKGYVPLYSTAVNTTENLEQSVMLAVSSGTFLGFSVIGEYDEEFAKTFYTELNGSSYAGNKTIIADVVSQCAEYYEAIEGQTMIDYRFISDSVTATVFSNGVTVYANHSNKKTVTPIGELGAYGFSYVTEEVE